ncbi:GYD domain-containing protein [Halosolutus gelatinilyticus]|uniref:GYD domain-containing protein n=1 Tax=Halosolutus gelatinilyticus TaxID=2931975 RepID=UPI001FF36E99|nr:GYD domain-containing protein [Halosolutus gelatinilyticus]
MPTYITLWNFTPEGAKTVRDSPSNVDPVADRFRELGGELREYYLLMGQYDSVSICDFPDDQTAAQAVLSVLEEGNATAETLRGFTAEEFAEMVDDMA